MLKKVVCALFISVLILILFNISYLANCGLLIPQYFWNRADEINTLNAFTHPHAVSHSKRSQEDPLTIADFRFEQLYSEQDAKSVSERVIAQKHLWQRRNAVMSTLGVSSYVDGFNSKEYQRLAKESNTSMTRLFGDVEQRILDYFRFRLEATNATVEFRENAALPGFHIFDGSELFSRPVASVHRDFQFWRLEYAHDENIDFKNTLSFTVSLQLPEGGAGLYMFDVPDVGLLQTILPRPLLTAVAQKTKIVYKTGYIVCHNGQTTHMIAPSPWKGNDSLRITLQGHGIYDWKKMKWYLYW
jgi:hypothetical protein